MKPLLPMWVAEARGRVGAVYRLSVQLLVNDMQTPVSAGGNMPVVTGELRGSLRKMGGLSLDLSGSGSKGVGVSFATQGADFEPVELLYTAPHALRMNYGFVGRDRLGRYYNQRGYYFVDKAVQRWTHFVSQATAQVRAKKK
jgi:hypothetical protein